LAKLIDDYRFRFRESRTDAPSDGACLEKGKMDLRWELQTISGFLVVDAGPAIVDELLLSPRADLSAGWGPWRVRFSPVHLPQINHLRTGDNISCRARPMGSPFLADIASQTYRQWWLCNNILFMSRPIPR
jgi:hypothetical protein